MCSLKCGRCSIHTPASGGTPPDKLVEAASNTSSRNASSPGSSAGSSTSPCEASRRISVTTLVPVVSAGNGPGGFGISAHPCGNDAWRPARRSRDIARSPESSALRTGATAALPGVRPALPPTPASSGPPARAAPPIDSGSCFPTARHTMSRRQHWRWASTAVRECLIAWQRHGSHEHQRSDDRRCQATTAESHAHRSTDIELDHARRASTSPAKCPRLAHVRAARRGVALSQPTSTLAQRLQSKRPRTGRLPAADCQVLGRAKCWCRTSARAPHATGNALAREGGPTPDARSDATPPTRLSVIARDQLPTCTCSPSDRSRNPRNGPVAATTPY